MQQFVKEKKLLEASLEGQFNFWMELFNTVAEKNLRYRWPNGHGIFLSFLLVCDAKTNAKCTKEGAYLPVWFVRWDMPTLL